MIETALFIVGTGICVLVVLFMLGVAIQVVGGVCSFIWDMVDPYGPMRGKNRE